MKILVAPVSSWLEKKIIRIHQRRRKVILGEETTERITGKVEKLIGLVIQTGKVSTTSLLFQMMSLIILILEIDETLIQVLSSERRR